ncbi:peptidase C11 clostripain (plasmid) [Ammonifex degensii KC4]|uniref:Peptidase C11 clostripain n=1 Tax=Ammonifex degensii (strain DSM 10501 / KC4) TaxID=429009 RepID=C9RDG0_AMMDK|nr:clostripain-related cysteine peptidase [Ammonifex degensii]ACX53231.1 peptidase C11 clostripain [Ammonifex degensii KC4]
MIKARKRWLSVLLTVAMLAALLVPLAQPAQAACTYSMTYIQKVKAGGTYDIGTLVVTVDPVSAEASVGRYVVLSLPGSPSGYELFPGLSENEIAAKITGTNYFNTANGATFKVERLSAREVRLWVGSIATAGIAPGDDSRILIPLRITVPSGVSGDIILTVSAPSTSAFLNGSLVIARADANLPDWVFAVYMAADNDLSRFALADLREMLSVPGLGGNVVVVLLDLPGSENDGVYLVQRGTLQPVPGWPQGQELNTGDPSLLAAFLDFVRNKFPAGRYALILWDHGAGWRKLQPRGVCFDDLSRDFLMVPELRQALVRARVPLDLVGFDACFMGMVEVAYELEGLASVMVASEEGEPGDGWPYDKILTWLVANASTADGKALGRAIVSAYTQAYQGYGALTMSAIDLGCIKDVREKTDSLAVALLRNFDSDKTQISQAVQNARSYHREEFRDLYDYASLLTSYCSSSVEIRAAAQDLQKSIERAVLANGTTQYDDRSRGLSIWLPPESQAYLELLSYYGVDFASMFNWYSNLRFAKESRWGHFIKKWILDESTPIATAFGVESTDPADGATDVPVDKTITLTYNTPVRPGPAYGKIALLDASGRKVSIRKKLAGTVFTIDPVKNLSYGTTYTLVLPAGAVKDGAGNLSEEFVLSFTTEPPDVTPPAVVETDPPAGGVVDSLKPVLKVRFSEQVYTGRNYSRIAIYDESGRRVAVSKRISGDLLEVRPVGALKPGMAYRLYLPAGAVKDKAGNLSEEFELVFVAPGP